MLPELAGRIASMLNYFLGQLVGAACTVHKELRMHRENMVHARHTHTHTHGTRTAHAHAQHTHGHARARGTRTARASQAPKARASRCVTLTSSSSTRRSCCARSPPPIRTSPSTTSLHRRWYATATPERQMRRVCTACPLPCAPRVHCRCATSAPTRRATCARRSVCCRAARRPTCHRPVSRRSRRCVAAASRLRARWSTRRRSSATSQTSCSTRSPARS